MATSLIHLVKNARLSRPPMGFDKLILMVLLITVFLEAQLGLFSKMINGDSLLAETGKLIGVLMY